MKATIYGVSLVDGNKFSYTLENVVCTQYILGTIIITYIKDGKTHTNAYNENNVKIIIEN